MEKYSSTQLPTYMHLMLFRHLLRTFQRQHQCCIHGQPNLPLSFCWLKWKFKYFLCESMPGHGLSSLARDQRSWTQHEELQDQTQDVVQGNKEQAVKLPKGTHCAAKDGQVSRGTEGGLHEKQLNENIMDFLESRVLLISVLVTSSVTPCKVKKTEVPVPETANLGTDVAKLRPMRSRS